MYIPNKYKEDSNSRIKDLIKNFPFGILFGRHSNRDDSVQLPFVLQEKSGKDILISHIPKHNKLSQFIIDKSEKEEEILVMFRGPNSYISSSLYEEPEVPTWDYASVNCYAIPRIQKSDELWLSLRELVAHFEKEMDKPVVLDSLPDHVKKQSQMIMGFELTAIEYQAQFKLSQGRSKADIERIVEYLSNKKQDHNSKLADLIRRHNEVY